MERNYNGVTVTKSWSLMAFAQEFGMPKLADMQVTKGDNGKWGIIMPDTSEVEMTINLE